MHRCVVPAQLEPPASEGAVPPLPYTKDFVNNDRQNAVELRKAASQQYGQIDALCVIVEFPAINDQPGRTREGFGQTSFIEEVCDVILDAVLNGGSTLGI